MYVRNILKYAVLMSVCLMVVLTTACGGDTTPPVTFPDLGPKEDTGTTPKPDLVAPDTGGEVVDMTPRVTIVGVQGLESYPALLCPSEKALVVTGQYLDGREIVLTLRAGSVELPLEVTGVADADDPDKLLFTVDFNAFMAPAEGEWVEGEPNLIDGSSFSIVAQAGTEEDVALFSTLKHEVSFQMDALPPVLTLTAPNTALTIAPVSGWLSIEGSLNDANNVSSVEVVFEDAVLTTLLPPADSEGLWEFKEEIDIRELPSGVGTLKIVGYDACGLAASVDVNSKIIRWPQLRSHESVTLPEEAGKVGQLIFDDLNGDDYPDVLVATTKGIFVSYNDWEAAFKGKDRFKTFTQLGTRGTTLIFLEDLDNDGDLDLVAVETEASKYVLSIYRRHPDGGLERVEEHSLALQNSTKVVDMVVTDFTANAFQAPDGAARSDIMIATDNQDEALVFFKRQNPDQPQDFDQCADVWVANAFPEAAADVTGDPGGEIVVECPTLFAPPVTASGVDKITQMHVYDVTGINSSNPDGYPEVIVGADQKNQINTFANRFSQVGIADTAFTESTISYAWIDPEAKTAKARYFCLGNFIKTGAGDDPIDLVVGTEAFGTWRILKGGGPLGKFYNSSTDEAEVGTANDVRSMVGTSGSNISGVTCGDFNLDGNDDFAITSQGVNLMQVLLGDGTGRFNQLPDSPFLNPANEGIGFVTEQNARHPQTVDLDLDGLPDFVLDHGTATFSIYMNISTALSGFELKGIRTLVTPLGKFNGAPGGLLKSMAIGDISGDGKDEIVAVSDAMKQPNKPWILFHPVASDYKSWIVSGQATKLGNGQVVYVWTQGENGNHSPSYPAAYDFISKEPYGIEEHGVVKPSTIKLMDIGGMKGAPQDSVLDIVLAGAKTSGTINSQLSVFVATNGGNFWTVANLDNPVGSMYEPMPGTLVVGESIQAFQFVNPEKIANIPGIVTTLATPGGRHVVFCPWVQEAEVPFWNCGVFPPSNGTKVGGPLRDMKRIAKVGPDAASSTDNPDTDANLVSIHDTTHSLTYFEYNSSKVEHPYEPAIEKAIGTSPQSLEFGDLDGDGIGDLVVAIKESIYVAFGQNALEPFTAPKPLDPLTKHSGEKALVLTDVNFDGWLDIAFTNKGTGRLFVYLNIGLEEQGMSKEHLFHGPISWSMCKGPSEVRAHAFNKSAPSCEDIVILCEQAGAVALLRNDGCF
jgi:hypothetical protein